MGPPGAGKGTQSNKICKEFDIPKISTGDMLRQAQEHDPELKKILSSGELVSDQKIIELLLKRIEQADCKDGFLLDGFPRTITQAEALQEARVDIDGVIQLDVADDQIVTRMAGRLVHMPSGRTYHIETNPPRIAGLDDHTGEPLTQREDDQELTVRRRLNVYHSQTEPLIAWYREYFTRKPGSFFVVNGMQEVEMVHDEVKNLLMQIEN